MKKLELIYDDGDTAYFSDRTKYYGLCYNDIDKQWFREYADVEPVEVEKDEDGDLCYYYDDEMWEVDGDMLEAYAKDYVKKDFSFKPSGDAVEYGEECMFIIHKGDNGWYESLEDYLKLKI